MEKIFIHIGIGLVIIIGFFWYWGRASGIFKEGGSIYEWWKNYRSEKNSKNNKPTKK